MGIVSYAVSTAKVVWGKTVDYIAHDAEAVSNGNGITNGLARNAISHAHGAADLTLSLGRNATAKLGNMKEDLSWTRDINDTYKDQFNNEVGKRIGEYVQKNLGLEGDAARAAIDDLVMDAYNNGYLIINPDTDPRIFTSTPDWVGPSNAWENASAGRDYTGTTSLEGALITLAEAANDLLNGIMNGSKDIVDAASSKIRDILDYFDLAESTGTPGGYVSGSPLVLDLSANGLTRPL